MAEGGVRRFPLKRGWLSTEFVAVSLKSGSYPQAVVARLCAWRGASKVQALTTAMNDLELLGALHSRGMSILREAATVCS